MEEPALWQHRISKQTITNKLLLDNKNAEISFLVIEIRTKRTLNKLRERERETGPSVKFLTFSCFLLGYVFINYLDFWEFKFKTNCMQMAKNKWSKSTNRLNEMYSTLILFSISLTIERDCLWRIKTKNRFTFSEKHTYCQLSHFW